MVFTLNKLWSIHSLKVELKGPIVMKMVSVEDVASRQTKQNWIMWRGRSIKSKKVLRQILPLSQLP